MLLGAVPSEADPAPADPAGGCNEDPFPRGDRPRPDRPPTPAQAALAGALVCPPLLFADDPLALSPLHLLVAVAAAGVAGFGTLATASLLAYSPTLLESDLQDEGMSPASRELEERHAEYLAVAGAFTAFGWITGMLALASSLDPSSPLGVALFLGAMMFFAGLLPVMCAQARPERALFGVLPLLRTAWWLLRWPLAVPMVALARGGMHLLRVRPSEAKDTEEVHKQVMAAVADSVTQELAEEERTWIGNIIHLKDLQVTTVMTPRPDIVAFADDTPLGEAVQKALEHGFSRYPVYHERIDEVVGIFYVKDALRLLQPGNAEQAKKPVRTMLRQTIYVPETAGAAQLLRQLQAGHQHMAIVIDEYGTTVGLATVEDLLEEIVGDIDDEYDPPAATPTDDQMRVIEPGRIVELSARTQVSQLNELLGTSLPEDGDWETIAGLVIARCNHIPAVDETVVVDDVEFRVLAADDRRVHRVRVTLLAPEPAEGAG